MLTKTPKKRAGQAAAAEARRFAAAIGSITLDPGGSQESEILCNKCRKSVEKGDLGQVH